MSGAAGGAQRRRSGDPAALECETVCITGDVEVEDERHRLC
jgi:hypothetical protein